uniref:Dachshund b n=1 Tax=Seriola lalandi dorsalis TaxID=1841481 RepID=A0A3B4WIL8_SERLL
MGHPAVFFTFSLSSRPGRPPKRTLGVATMTDGSRLLPHGLLSPALLSQTGLTAAAMAEALKLQKMRMMMGFHGNSNQQRYHNGAESENDDTGGSEGSWEKEQRLLPPPSSVVAPPAGSASLHLSTLQQHSSLLANRLSNIPFMVMPHPLLPVGLPPASVAMAMNQMSQLSGLANMAAVSQVQTEEGKVISPRGSPSPCPSPSDDELHPLEPTSQSPSRASSSSSSSPPPAHVLCGSQGLLKVAVESARSQDKHNQLERKELKLELERERDARQVLQKQLSSELQSRGETGQQRLKKEKKAKRKLQEALDFESRRREQVERALTGEQIHLCPRLFSSSMIS